MDYLPFVLLAIATIGYASAEKTRVKRLGGHDLPTGSTMPAYGVFAVIALIAGMVWCFIRLGWWGVVPVLLAIITVNLAKRA